MVCPNVVCPHVMCVHVMCMYPCDIPMCHMCTHVICNHDGIFSNVAHLGPMWCTCVPTWCVPMWCVTMKPDNNQNHRPMHLSCHTANTIHQLKKAMSAIGLLGVK